MAVNNRGRTVPKLVSRRRNSNASSAIPVKNQLQKRSRSLSRPSRNTRSSKARADEAESLEIPCLNELGLYAVPTEGDGNCLYYALSDQVYGDFTHAEEIRLRLADQILTNKEYFINFVAAEGGERRAPRRAATSVPKYSSPSSSASASPAPPSERDKERSFQDRLAESRKNGTWGGSEEIQAFCQSYKLDATVYTKGGIVSFRDVHAKHGDQREHIHLAYHNWSHYSSVRHSGGTHSGLPCISVLAKEVRVKEEPQEEHQGMLQGVPHEEPHEKPEESEEIEDSEKSEESEEPESPEERHEERYEEKLEKLHEEHYEEKLDKLHEKYCEEKLEEQPKEAEKQLKPEQQHQEHCEEQHEKLHEQLQEVGQKGYATTRVLEMPSPWKISAIEESLGGKYDRGTIIEMLKQCRGNIDRAFSNLLGEASNLPPGEATASKAMLKLRLPASRSTSPISTGSKRSAEESEDEEDPRPPIRRRLREQKGRILPDVTVGISFGEGQSDLVSLRLQVSPDVSAEMSSGSGRRIRRTTRRPGTTRAV